MNEKQFKQLEKLAERIADYFYKTKGEGWYDDRGGDSSYANDETISGYTRRETRGATIYGVEVMLGGKIMLSYKEEHATNIKKIIAKATKRIEELEQKNV